MLLMVLAGGAERVLRHHETVRDRAEAIRAYFKDTPYGLVRERPYWDAERIYDMADGRAKALAHLPDQLRQAAKFLCIGAAGALGYAMAAGLAWA